MEEIARQDQEKKKEYEFNLLRRREAYLRADYMTTVAVTILLVYSFGWRLVDKEDLLGIGMLVLGILFNGVLLLLNHWSVSAHETFAYKKLSDQDIDVCSHVRVRINNKKQNVIKRHIVPLTMTPMEFAPGKVNKSHSIDIQKKRFSFNKKSRTFEQIPYPVNETIEFY